MGTVRPLSKTVNRSRATSVMKRFCRSVTTTGSTTSSVTLRKAGSCRVSIRCAAISVAVVQNSSGSGQRHVACARDASNRVAFTIDLNERRALAHLTDAERRTARARSGLNSGKVARGPRQMLRAARPSPSSFPEPAPLSVADGDDAVVATCCPPATRRPCRSSRPVRCRIALMPGVNRARRMLSPARAGAWPSRSASPGSSGKRLVAVALARVSTRSFTRLRRAARASNMITGLSVASIRWFGMASSVAKMCFSLCRRPGRRDGRRCRRA